MDDLLADLEMDEDGEAAAAPAPAPAGAINTQGQSSPQAFDDGAAGALSDDQQAREMKVGLGRNEEGVPRALMVGVVFHPVATAGAPPAMDPKEAKKLAKAEAQRVRFALVCECTCCSDCCFCTLASPLAPVCGS